MASFIAKQLIGNQLDSVKGALGDKKDDDGGSGAKEIDPEVEAALREAEARREAKHQKMEEEREVMRQEIRDKYGIKKKEEENPEFDFSSPEGRLGRKRKTPAEMAAEAAAAEEAENSITNMLPENMRDIANKVTEVPGKLISEASDKCTVM
uniref:Putative complexin-1-like n=1 Tax=Cryptocotyle lingua TaxID=66766 RepID=A0A7U0TI57_9TREM|nr:putative complexin-1-like [Cryptocotyle lingua]